MPTVPLEQIAAGCRLTLYHGTYSMRAREILREGIRPRAERNTIWLARSPRFAWRHAAVRRHLDGCSDQPIVVFKVHILAADFCPVTRWKLTPKGLPQLFVVTGVTIPPENLEVTDMDERAMKWVGLGDTSGERQMLKRKRPHPTSCPPPVKLAKGKKIPPGY